jgi:protein O-mannosyl-transferase
MPQQSAKNARVPDAATAPNALSRSSPILLFCAGVAAYANSFAGVFLFDDYRSILEDSRLASLPAFLAHLPGMIRPLLRATFLADRMLWGSNPAGYHAINLALHIGCGLLIYAIVRQFGEAAVPAKPASGDGIAFVAALLFLVHPIGTETVTYLSGRATGLAAFCYLSGLLLYLCASRPEAAASSRLYAGAAGCFALAMAAKETAITFPLALLLVESVIRRARGAALREIVLGRLAGIWVVLLALVAVAAFYRRYRDLAGAALGVESVYGHLVAQIDAVGYALMLFVAPGAMNFDHDFPHYGSLFVWPVLLALLLIAGLIALALHSVRSQPLLAFGIAWFFLQLLPTNGLLQRDDLLSERNLYLPAAGVFIAFASVWFTVERRAAHWLALEQGGARAAAGVLAVALVAMIAFFAAGTVARNALYSDPVAFWSDAASKSPLKARPHVNLGHAYLLAGDVSRAADEFRLALWLDPDNPVAQRNLRAAWERGSAP